LLSRPKCGAKRLGNSQTTGCSDYGWWPFFCCALDADAHNAYTAYMVLNIRNLPDEVHSRLRVRAARHGRSMEAEARAILTAACPPESDTAASLPEWVTELYEGKKPSGVVEDLIRERRRESASE